jgi:branched-chain amino acid transport system substrate-binding protein
VTLAVAAVGAAACGGGSSGGGSSSSGGSGGSSGGKAYTIACQGPLTGDNAALGINICDGAKLAIQQAKGLPFKINYKAVDDQGTPDGSRPAAASIVQDSSVVAVVGPAFSGATQAAEGTFAQAHLLSMTASATLPTLTDPKNGFTTFYRAVATDSSQGQAAAHYLKNKLHVKKVYSVDDAEAYGQGLAQTLEKTLKSEGIAVVHDSVPQGNKQWEPEAAKVKQSGADAVYYSGYYSDAGPFAKALHNAGYTGIFMSDDGTKDPNFVKLAGTAAANGAYFTCPCSDATKNGSFASAYKSAFNQDPGTYSAEAYDVANAIISAMKSLGGNISREALAKAAANIDYKGITKTVSFGSNHELKTNTVYLYKVNNGNIDYIGPIS